jgi:hypothetical protein
MFPEHISFTCVHHRELIFRLSDEIKREREAVSYDDETGAVSGVKLEREQSDVKWKIMIRRCVLIVLINLVG